MCHVFNRALITACLWNLPSILFFFCFVLGLGYERFLTPNLQSKFRELDWDLCILSIKSEIDAAWRNGQTGFKINCVDVRHISVCLRLVVVVVVVLRSTGLILSSGYCLSGELFCVIWVSSSFFSFVPPLKNMSVGGLALLNCPWVWMYKCVVSWDALPSHSEMYLNIGHKG